MLKEEEFMKAYVYGFIPEKYLKHLFHFTKPVKKLIDQILDTTNFFP